MRGVTVIVGLLVAVLGGAAMAADGRGAGPMPAAAPVASETPLQRAQLRARRSAVLSAGLNGMLAKVDVREGEPVQEGAVLAVIDCAQQQASKRLAEAKATGARAKQRVAERMAQLNQGSILETELARSDVAMGVAEIAAIDAVLRRCSVTAPFSGVAVALYVRRNQYVREGDPIIELLDPHEPEIEMVLPARWLARLAPGQSFQFQSDDVGGSFPAVVERINSKVDPVSSTVRVLGRLTAPSGNLLPGMSGSVRFEFPGGP